MIEQQILQFLEEQTDAIKPLYVGQTHAYWEATATGNKEAYEKYEFYQKEIAKFFNNPENFRKTKEFLDSKIEDELVERQLRLLYNSYLGNQGDLNLINKIVEKSTLIEEKFNKFRAKIEGKEFTDNQIKDILKEENDSKKLQEAWEASKMQGEFVAKELIELIKLRNELAKSLGFKNYYVLSLEANEQTEEELIKLFSELEEYTDKPFREVKKEVDEILSKKYGVSELKPWHYHDLFFQEAPKIYNVDLDRIYNDDILKKAEDFYSSIGLEVSDILKRSDLYEKPGKYQHAYCMDLDREGDIRSLMNIKDDSYWMATILHELGHAVYWKYIDKELPFLIRDASHTLTTEAIALLMERNAKNTSFIRRYCKLTEEELSKIEEEVKKSLKLRQLVFSRWSQVMFYFERSLYENPDQDLNKLWWDLVSKYQLLDFSRDKADWASKIHFVSSPIYYHNYIIGELFASQINNYIAKNILNENTTKNLDYSGKKEIGDYLKSRIFFPGTLYKWDNLIEKSTDEKLNPEHWVDEFC